MAEHVLSPPRKFPMLMDRDRVKQNPEIRTVCGGGLKMICY